MQRRALLLLTVALTTITASSAGLSGCARPYSGPKTLAALAATALVTGAATWAIGKSSGSDVGIAIGVGATAAGAVGAIGAGAWLAAKVACHDDPDCPDGEECKEIPAPPGGIPYKQCQSR